MPGPKFRPCDWAVDPQLFGRGAVIAWREADGDAELRELGTAKLQHMWAVRIRRRLSDKNLKLSAYAELSGSKYDRLSKVLRGVVLMRLEDLADAHRHLPRFLPDGPRAPDQLGDDGSSR
jgi:hypothetical protein